MTIGPQLPPSLLDKRKRDNEDQESDRQSSSSPDSTSKSQRVVGPTLPPAPLDERPPHSPPQSGKNDSGDESSSDEDDFGPALPSKAKDTKSDSKTASAQTFAPAPAVVHRDEWMTIAPTNGDWSSRLDPTKLKSRTFTKGKGVKAPSAGAGGGDAWHETPEQKQARLQREMMGIKDETPTIRSARVAKPERDAEAEATAKRVRDYNTARGPSLYESKQKKKKDEDDDPSARTFDYQKDMAGGLQINATQRREMMKKATDFGSRFAGARYL